MLFRDEEIGVRLQLAIYRDSRDGISTSFPLSLCSLAKYVYLFTTKFQLTCCAHFALIMHIYSIKANVVFIKSQT